MKNHAFKLEYKTNTFSLLKDTGKRYKKKINLNFLKLYR